MSNPESEHESSTNPPERSTAPSRRMDPSKVGGIKSKMEIERTKSQKKDPGNDLDVALPVPMALVAFRGHTSLAPGENLAIGDALMSENDRYVLRLREDGNLVLGRPGEMPTWSTRTKDKGVVIARMQRDGNFVLYTEDGTAIWATNTDGHPGAMVLLRDNGDFIVMDRKLQVWPIPKPCREESIIERSHRD